MKKAHQIDRVTFEDNVLSLHVDGNDYRFPLAGISPRLLAASPAEREHFKISPSGYGIHWPAIDENLSIDGLLGISHKPAFQRQQAAV